jgi:acetyltransferase-like isoleucine patch superfamily enzyme
LGGVIIGAHSIVAAGAVVTRSVKEYSVNAGIPARTIRYRNEAEMNHSSNSRERNE